jgi:hypothetical protein
MAYDARAKKEAHITGWIIYREPHSRQALGWGLQINMTLSFLIISPEARRM